MSLTLAMAALIGSIVAAIGSTGSSIYQSYKNAEAQKEANETNLSLTERANQMQMEMAERANAFSASEAQKNRDWQTELSNTQYQRAMADMKAAGLNPILAANPGGASVGSVGNAGANMAAISAGKVSPVNIDLSGVTSAFNAMSNTMLISAMLGGSSGGSASGLNKSVLNAIRASR